MDAASLTLSAEADLFLKPSNVERIPRHLMLRTDAKAGRQALKQHLVHNSMAQTRSESRDPAIAGRGEEVRDEADMKNHPEEERTTGTDRIMNHSRDSVIEEDVDVIDIPKSRSPRFAAMPSLQASLLSRAAREDRTAMLKERNVINEVSSISTNNFVIEAKVPDETGDAEQSKDDVVSGTPYREGGKKISVSPLFEAGSTTRVTDYSNRAPSLETPYSPRNHNEATDQFPEEDATGCTATDGKEATETPKMGTLNAGESPQKHRLMMDSVHKFKLTNDRLTSENFNLKERLAVSEARAAHASEVEGFLQESECAVANLETELNNIMEKNEAQMDMHRGGKKKDLERFEKKKAELVARLRAVEKSKESAEMELTEKLRVRDSTISSLEKSVKAAESEIHSVAQRSMSEIGQLRELASQEDVEKDAKVKALAGQLESKNQIVKALESEIRQVTASVEEQMQVYEDELKAKNVEIESHNEAVEAQNQQMESLHRESNACRNDVTSLKENIDCLVKELDETRNALKTSESEVDTLKHRNNSLSKESEEVIRDLENRVANNLNSHEEMKSALTKEQNMASELQKELLLQKETMDSLQEETKEEIEWKDDQIRKIQSDVNKCDGERMALSGRISQQEQDIEQLVEENSVLKSLNSSLSVEVNSVKRSVTDLKEALDESEAYVARLEQLNALVREESRVEHQSLQKEVEFVKKVKEDLESQLKSEIESLDGSHKALQEELGTTSNSLTAHKNIVSSLRQEIDQMNSHFEEHQYNFQEEIEKTKRDCQDYQSKITEQDQTLQNLENELSDANQSNLILSRENGQLKDDVTAMKKMESRICHLDALLQESETVVAQLEQENSTVREKNQKTMHAMRQELTESTKMIESKLKAQMKSVQVEKEVAVKELEMKLKEVNDLLVIRDKDLTTQKESTSSYRSEMRRLVSNIEEKMHTSRREKEKAQQTYNELQEKLDLWQNEREIAEQELMEKDRRIASQEKDLSMLMKDVEKGKISNGALREQVSSLRGRLFKSEELASRTSTLEVSLENVMREKADSDDKNVGTIEDLERKVSDAFARKNAMEKELKRNTDLLIKVKDKMVKSASGKKKKK